METVETVIAERTNTPNGYYTSRYSGEEIDRKLDIMVSPNLLGNAYFVGGGTGWGALPINQRGQESYFVTNSSIDRWFVASGQSGQSMSLLPNGIQKTSGALLFQKLNEVLVKEYQGEAMTASVLTTSGLTTFEFVYPETGFVQYPDGSIVVGVASGFGHTFPAFTIGFPVEGPIIAAKLEEGTGQTLAYQGADGLWHMLPQPDMDYRIQLLMCQSYFQIYSTAEGRPAKAIDCRPVMRIDPTPGTLVINGVTYYTNNAEL